MFSFATLPLSGQQVQSLTIGDVTPPQYFRGLETPLLGLRKLETLNEEPRNEPESQSARGPSSTSPMLTARSSKSHRTDSPNASKFVDSSWRDEHFEKRRQKDRAFAETVRQDQVRECTFFPQVLDYTPPGSQIVVGPRIFQRRLPEKRFNEIEKRMFKDVTHRPKLVAKPVCRPGPALPVFERLFSLRNKISKPAVESPTATPRRLTSSTASSPVRSPIVDEATNRLYQDALTRRSKAELVAAERKEAQRRQSDETVKVSSRSRRHYWQWLEKRVAEAFAATTDSDNLVSNVELLSFLMNMKCITTVSSLSQSQCQLLEGLWTTLDVNGENKVDLLVLTVFFHLLMGISGTSNTVIQPPTPSTADSSNSSMYKTDVSVEDRVAALMSIFSPGDLRARFGQLCLEGTCGKWHVKNLTATKNEVEQNELKGVPTILEKSKELANEEEKRIMSAMASTQSDSTGVLHREDIMLFKASQSRAKIEQLRREKEAKALSQCTFKPQITPRPVDLFFTPRTATPSTAAATPARPATTSSSSSGDRFIQLYSKAMQSKSRFEKLAEEKEAAREIDELAQCTFKPNLSSTRPKTATTVVIPGLRKAVDRFVKINKEKPTVPTDK